MFLKTVKIIQNKKEFEKLLQPGEMATECHVVSWSGEEEDLKQRGQE